MDDTHNKFYVKFMVGGAWKKRFMPCARFHLKEGVYFISQGMYKETTGGAGVILAPWKYINNFRN